MDSFGHLTSDSLSLVMDFCDRSAGWFDRHNGAGRTLRERERERNRVKVQNCFHLLDRAHGHQGMLGPEVLYSPLEPQGGVVSAVSPPRRQAFAPLVDS